jgi:hypothetical protein
MKIVSYIFDEHLHNPLKVVNTIEENGKFVTKDGYWTIKTVRQNLDLKDRCITNKEEAIKLHEKEREMRG